LGIWLIFRADGAFKILSLHLNLCFILPIIQPVDVFQEFYVIVDFFSH
jgi:hypothetical protein